jgi:hypothetical protein
MTPDGHVPVIGSTNGDPKGPRVKRAGWSGWWVYDDQQRLIPDPDGPEPRRLLPRVEPEARPEPPVSIARPARGWRPCPNVAWHGTTFKYLNKQGHQVCRECQRDRNRERRKAA